MPPPEKILPEVGAPQPDEQTQSTSREIQTPSPVAADLGDARSVFADRECTLFLRSLPPSLLVLSSCDFFGKLLLSNFYVSRLLSEKFNDNSSVS